MIGNFKKGKIINKKSFSKLSRGDIVKHIGDIETFVVTSNYGKRVTATTTVDMTNPNEWELVLKAKYNKLPKISQPIEINNLNNTTVACPSQWEFFTFDEIPVYVRYRWGYLTISIGISGEDISTAYNGTCIFEREIGNSADGFIEWPVVKKILNEITKKQIIDIIKAEHDELSKIPPPLSPPPKRIIKEDVSIMFVPNYLADNIKRR